MGMKIFLRNTNFFNGLPNFAIGEKARAEIDNARKDSLTRYKAFAKIEDALTLNLLP